MPGLPSRVGQTRFYTYLHPSRGLPPPKLLIEITYSKECCDSWCACDGDPAPRRHEFRVFYVARFEEAVYVLHCFVKKTQATRKADIDLGKQRYATLREARKSK